MTQFNSRRDFLAASACAAIGVVASPHIASAAREEEPAKDGASKVRYCFNTSTIRGQKIPLPEIVDMVAEAGYDGIEPWVREIGAYKEAGGKLSDLKKQISDKGLTVDSAIGFARWIVDDEKERAEGLEVARRDMELVRSIGGTRIAAPPAGANNGPKIDLFAAAERFAALAKVGDEFGIRPQVEVWGFSANLSRLGETAFVAIESGRPDALILPDVYHIFKGGSDFAGLELLAGKSMEVFHVNDYPASPAREEMKDADRVYCGDGVAPLTKIFRTILNNGFAGSLSLELFNPTLWKQDPKEVMKTGLAKTKAAFAKAIS